MFCCIPSQVYFYFGKQQKLRRIFLGRNNSVRRKFAIFSNRDVILHFRHVAIYIIDFKVDVPAVNASKSVCVALDRNKNSILAGLVQ
ncbi:hypothetical protein BV392_07375 [Rhodovulum sulfidophilum]|nr:hypothetical protein BV392_07375 [Rhodovulum sulfidophilum]